MSGSYWNLEKNDDIVCPYCGNEYAPTYEETIIGDKLVNCYEDGFHDVFTCDNCKKNFKLTSILKWEYETETIDGEMTQEEWEEL